MKKNILLFVSVILLFAACVDNEKLMFESSPNIIFEADSAEFSWMSHPVDMFEYKVKCKLVGQKLSKSKEFTAEIVNEKTTAEEGVNYMDFSSKFTWPADTFEYELPVKLINNDFDLETNPVYLTIRLKGADGLGTNFDGPLEFKINITANYIKPPYWDKYNLSYYFGEYSKVKHRIIISFMGKDFPIEQMDWKHEGAVWKMMGRSDINQYFIDNTVKDENGNIIEPWV